jgi:diketogulonate reductase-like aldo/keto reductase
MTGAVATDRRASTLADGAQLPLLGLGVWQVPNGRECVDAVRWALELGYRHIDTAQAYGNEESVGQGLRESGVPRDQVFITTKFRPSQRDPVVEVERSLQRLGVERVDLYIVHWPGGGPTWAWPSPLGHGLHIGSETATGIAQRLGRTPAQVLLRWCIERDVPLITKSTHRDRIAENAQIFDFTLSNADMAELDALDGTGSTHAALERKWW